MLNVGAITCIANDSCNINDYIIDSCIGYDGCTFL